MSEKQAEAQETAEVWQRGFSRGQAPVGEEQGGTSVPEGPPKRRGTTKVLGPGSIAGTLCMDPTMTFSPGGKAITKVRLAVSKRIQDPVTRVWSDGETEFTDVTVWGKQGENVMESLSKGDRVVVNGIWQEDEWEGRDGEQQRRRTLSARDIGPSLLFRQAMVQRKKEGS